MKTIAVVVCCVTLSVWADVIRIPRASMPAAKKTPATIPMTGTPDLAVTNVSQGSQPYEVAVRVVNRNTVPAPANLYTLRLTLWAYPPGGKGTVVMATNGKTPAKPVAYETKLGSVAGRGRQWMTFAAILPAPPLPPGAPPWTGTATVSNLTPDEFANAQFAWIAIVSGSKSAGAMDADSNNNLLKQLYPLPPKPKENIAGIVRRDVQSAPPVKMNAAPDFVIAKAGGAPSGGQLNVKIVNAGKGVGEGLVSVRITLMRTDANGKVIEPVRLHKWGTDHEAMQFDQEVSCYNPGDWSWITISYELPVPYEASAPCPYAGTALAAFCGTPTSPLKQWAPPPPRAENITWDDYNSQRFAWKIAIDPDNSLAEASKLNNALVRAFPLPTQDLE